MATVHSTAVGRRTLALVALLIAASCRRAPAQYWITSMTSGYPSDSARAAAEREPVTPLRRGTVVTREPLGAFVLMVERLPDGEFPEMHSGERWPRIHLSFDVPSQRVNVTLTDDGSRLDATAHAPGCMVIVRYLQYGDDHELFSAMTVALRHLVRECRGAMERPDEVQTAFFGRGSAEFDPALALMKARVRELVSRSTTRCTPPEESEILNFNRC